eukprot:776009-Pleurochrysis_carterae.AAC.2
MQMSTCASQQESRARTKPSKSKVESHLSINTGARDALSIDVAVRTCLPLKSIVAFRPAWSAYQPP